MKQSDKRRHIIILLYLSEFHEKQEMEDQLQLYKEMWIDEEDAFAYIKEKFTRVLGKLGVIDPMIASVSAGWKLDRMGRIDLNIMRLAVYEMFYDEEVPANVAIAEAVILAKDYGKDDSAMAFINGILGKLEKNRAENE